MKNNNNNLKKHQTEYWEIISMETQGKRSAMEDYSDIMTPFTSQETSLLLSVFDGHVGHRCASFLANTLPSELQKETIKSSTSPQLWQTNYNNNSETPASSPSSSCCTSSVQGTLLPNEEVFKKIFKSVDQMWLDSAALNSTGKREEKKVYEDGSTALCVALDCGEVMIANCGDCRAILSQGGQTIALTRDHRPTDEEEHQRIINQGGNVIGGRLQGSLAVSRAFGNYEFKELQILSSEPEIHHVTLTSDIEYLVIGSDGLYEHFTNEEIITFIKNGLMSSNPQKNLETVVKDLIEEALDRGTEDNITILVIKFEKAFKKFLKKRAKKQASGKSPSLLPRANNNKLVCKVTPPESPETASKCLFKKAQKLNSGKNSSVVQVSSEVNHHHSPTHKKKSETITKKLKPCCEKTTAFSKLPCSPGRAQACGVHHLVGEKVPFAGAVAAAAAADAGHPHHHDHKWNRLAFPTKPFKSYDLFGARTPVTISDNRKNKHQQKKC